MEALKPVELKLAELFKKLPSLPEDIRKFLATYAWIFALVGAILSGIAAIVLLFSLLFVSATTTVEHPSNIYVVDAVQEVKQVLFWAWVALAVLALDALILGRSVSGLKAMAKSGWNLAFLSALLTIVYNVFNWLRYSESIGGLIWQLFWAVVLFYVLFQIRDKFSKTTPAPNPQK